jgi:hypothetical protein
MSQRKKGSAKHGGGAGSERSRSKGTPSSRAPASPDSSRTRRRAIEDAEIDRMALHGPKSKWQEASESAAGDPETREELAGIDLLGRASVRDDAIPGPSEASAESGIDHPEEGPEGDQRRRNPPLEEDVSGPGGISMSGGASGGARGQGGTSDRGAGTPKGYEKAGPGEQKSTSRFDLNHGTLEEPET